MGIGISWVNRPFVVVGSRDIAFRYPSCGDKNGIRSDLNKKKQTEVVHIKPCYATLLRDYASETHLQGQQQSQSRYQVELCRVVGPRQLRES